MRVLLVASTMVNETVPGYRWQPFEAEVEWADELAEQAGRLCYLSWERPNPKTATNEGYLANILAQQHFSVLEHGSATFYVDGVSRNFTHELIRHRHLSFSEVSQRYVDVSTFDTMIPPALAGTEDEGLADDGLEVLRRARLVYDGIINQLTGRGKTRKEARQAARFILPSGTETKILVTGNHRAWRDMLPKRLSPQADLEFQGVAKEILKLLKGIAPNTYQDIEVPE